MDGAQTWAQRPRTEACGWRCGQRMQPRGGVLFAGLSVPAFFRRPSSTCPSHRLQRQLKLCFRELYPLLPASPIPIPVLQHCSPGEQGVKRSRHRATPVPPAAHSPDPPRLGSQNWPWPLATTQFVRCFVSILLQFCPWTGCLSALRWDWSNQRLCLGVGVGKEGECDTRGPLARLCDPEPPPNPASCTPPPRPLHIQSQYKECESCSGQGSLNRGWRDCLGMHGV